MVSVSIVDYGMGNLRSVGKALERAGARAEIITEPRAVARAEKLVLPGVGAFRDAIAHLRQQGLVEPINDFLGSGRPFLGICLGLQLLFTRSYEDGEYEGLGYFAGEVRRFDLPPTLKVPHMGWNQLEVMRPAPLLRGLPDRPNVYFVHSYFVVPNDPAVIATQTDYGGRFTSMVWRDNVFATQFHPEKSQTVGLTILKNFVEL